MLTSELERARIVSEQELPDLLAQGGHDAAVQPSGKVVVET